MSDNFDKLITVLQQDLNLTGTEIAEIIWLAAQRPTSVSPQSSTPVPDLSQTSTPVSNNEPNADENSKRNSGKSPTPDVLDNKTNADKNSKSNSVKSPTPDVDKKNIVDKTPTTKRTAKIYAKTDSRHDSLEIALPDVAAIPDSLKLARAYRPLKQFIPSGKDTIDEVATAESTAESKGIFTPIFKPCQELKFGLELVIDQSESMIFWRRTTQEFQQLCEHYGIFRKVRTWGMVTDEQGKIRLHQGINKNAGSSPHSAPKRLIDPSSRQLILVVSDCVGESWRNDKVIEVLNTWGKHNSVAIVQMLPTWMWWRTGLRGGTMVQLDSRLPGAVANQNLEIAEILFGKDIERKQRVKVPVFSLEPDLVQNWSEMVVRKGTIGATGFMFPRVSEENSTPPSNPPFKAGGQGGMERGVQQRYDDFRMSSSPMAQELASLLAAAPVVNLPIVRLIRRTLLRELQPVHVAEVFLGGILQPQDSITPETNPDDVQYRFIGDSSTNESERIRSLFLKDSPTAKSVQIVTEISRYFAEHLGKNLKEFYGLLQKPDDLKQVQTEKGKEYELKHFAEITTHILKQLGGVYVDLAEEIEAGLQGESRDTTLIFPLPELFSFETVFVDRKGETTKQETRRTWYFKEQLPPIDSKDITLEMVAIPGGTFIMGTADAEIERLEQKYDDKEHFRRERPQHEVTIEPFFMGTTPITQAQWRAIASRTDLKVNRDLDPDQTYFKDDPDPQTLPNYKSSQRVPTRWDRPVEEISWHDAVEFCQRLSNLTGRTYRLPSEAEWEYACRAILPDCQNPTYPRFHFGETLTDQLANYRATFTYADEPKGQCREQTTPVRSFPPNAFGLYDMHGNVWEWCLDDWHENDYEGAPRDGKAWSRKKTFEPHKMLRGGCWGDNASWCRAAFRNYFHSSRHFHSFGFRVVCVPGRTDLVPQLLEVLEFFSLKTVFVNKKGETIKQETHRASYFKEQLPPIDSEDITLEMVKIPGGTFTMGTAEAEIKRLNQKYAGDIYDRKREGPQHQVTIEPFFMGTTPITQAQWRAIASRKYLKVNHDLDPDRAHFKDDPDPQTLPNYKSSQRVPTRWDRPVERVSWEEAVEFCARLSRLTGRQYRLPSEAEWEYACRAILPDCQNPTYPPFHFGETLTDQLANYRANSTYADEPLGQHRQQTTPVGSFPPNAFGLYDMHGNVWEWCLDDWHENYEGAPTDGKAWLENKKSKPAKMWRGGGWNDQPDLSRAAFRNYHQPHKCYDSVGFRVVCVSDRTL